MEVRGETGGYRWSRVTLVVPPETDRWVREGGCNERVPLFCSGGLPPTRILIGMAQSLPMYTSFPGAAPIVGAPFASGAPIVSGAPIFSGAPFASGAPFLSGVPMMQAAPATASVQNASGSQAPVASNVAPPTFLPSFGAPMFPGAPMMPGVINAPPELPGDKLTPQECAIYGVPVGAVWGAVRQPEQQQEAEDDVRGTQV
eukprot:747516-Hanusia_phi.AAC.1